MESSTDDMDSATGYNIRIQKKLVDTYETELWWKLGMRFGVSGLMT